MESIDPGLKGVINFFVPAVYLREKIQTDSFGMDITDILCIVGLLVEVKHNKYMTWYLWEGCYIRRIYLCLGGLFLDRHQSFNKKLFILPLLFIK